MITDYADQKWRILTAPLEGMVWLPVVIGSLVYKHTSRGAAVTTEAATNTFAGAVAVSRLIWNTWFWGDEDTYSAKDTRGYMQQIVHFACLKVTQISGTERVEETGQLEEVERPFKFYETGLTQAIAAFVLVPFLLVIGMFAMMRCTRPGFAPQSP